MAEENMVDKVGSSKGLCFSIRWEKRQARGTADEATRGWLGASVAGMEVWSEGSGRRDDNHTWSLIEVLEHLSWAWPYLVLEEIDPLGMGVRPDLSRVEANRRWEISAATTRMTEQKLLRAYEDCHDLSRAFQGFWLPPLWIQREGVECWLVSQCLVEKHPFDEVIGTVQSLGDAITARVAELADERAAAAVRGWRTRAELQPEQQISIATGLDMESLQALAGHRSLAEVFEYPGGFEQSELVAAARMMAGSIGPGDMGRILRRLREIEPASTRLADELGAEALRVLASFSGLPPHDQGNHLARWLRNEKLALGDGQAFDPERYISETLGVDLSPFDIESNQLDAICVWGTRHGPAILLNSKGRHSQGKAGRRATLAHEICHVLLDRRGALPLAEVMGGRISRSVEARARSFAAELLVPQSVAGEAFSASAEPAKAMSRLRKRYGASSEIIAWQAHNSGAPLSQIARKYLRDRVSMPERFYTGGAI